MCPELLTVRYPSGKTEFRTRETFPEVGEVLESRQETWVVEEVLPSEDGAPVVVLKPVMPNDGAT
jgi:hypothetical protein